MPRVARTAACTTAVVALLLSAACAEKAPAPAAPRPNVLLIVADDLNVQLGTYGKAVQTPNIDRLARLGRRFDAAYTPFPLCNPSRASLMTGWHPARTRVWDNAVRTRELLRGARTLERVFREAGYFTVRFGKIYHFDEEYEWDLAEDAPPDPPIQDASGETRRRRKVRFEDKWEASALPDAELPDGRTARRAAQLLVESRERPLFLAVGFVRPHGPWIAPKRYFDLYPEDRLVLPSYPEDELDDVPDAAVSYGAEPPIPPGEHKKALAAYLACVSFVDAQLGVVLEALDRGDLWRNTVVVFLSDHGIHRGEHGLWRKNTLFEESARVPLLIAAPGLREPGQATSRLAELTDVYPTLLDLAGLPPVPDLDGVSLAPLLKDPSRVVRNAAFTTTERGGKLAASVRTERHRLTLWPDGSRELYDHATDPEERTNRASDPSLVAVATELSRLAAEPRSAIVPSAR
jgi:uncharacterized sulfatase